MKANRPASGARDLESDNPALVESLQRLKALRQALVPLHKTLVGYQRQRWESLGGQVNNSYELLNVVMHDPAFAWLRRLSESIVQIDELLASQEDAEEIDAQRLLEQVEKLLTPSESGEEFQRNYFEALQQSPDVVLGHAEVVSQLGRKRKVKMVNGE